jgi:hypothetical protein
VEDCVDVYWKSIRENICRICTHGNGTGECSLPSGETCAIETFLPEIAEIVATVRSKSFEPYIDLLRGSICPQCDHHVGGGQCVKRETLDCALDRYYPMVLEVVESARAEIEHDGKVVMRRV